MMYSAYGSDGKESAHNARDPASILVRGHVSRGSAGEYQADEWAEVARLRWLVSGR